MKKTFNLKFMALSVLLMLGHVCVFAQDPAVGQAVGTTLKGNVVTYRVNNSKAAVEVEGEKTYPVSITGLDADGLAQLGSNITLEVPVTFREKLGEEYYRFYVTEIAKGLDGSTPQSFYGYTEISKLKFSPVKTGENNNEPYYALANFSYSVGDYAFYGCTGMRTLEFTTNCKSIGKYAFQNTAIRNFVIPQGCETIDEYAFYECGYLTRVEVASGNTAMHTLGTHVFGKSSLEELDLRNATELWTITGEPFMHELNVANDVLKRVQLPTSLKAINTAFANCTALEGFGLAPGATGYDANNNPGDLDQTSLGLPANSPAGSPAGEGIEDGAFAGCRKLAVLNFPNCDIAGQPFAGCVALSKITFVANYDKTIGTTYTKAMTNLFGNCDVNDADYEAKYEATQKALKQIIFKGPFRGTIADNAFVGVKGLTTVNFNGGLRYGATINAAFTDVETLTNLTFTTSTSLMGLDTWNHVTTSGADKDVTIKAGAFQNTGISALDFGNLLASYANAAKIVIEGNAFSGNKNLASVTFGTTSFKDFGGGLVHIYDNAFGEGNAALATVTFGEISTTAGKAGKFLIGSKYDFSSYGEASKSTHYGDGTAALISYNGTTGVAKIKVLSNPADESYVGKIFSVTVPSGKDLYDNLPDPSTDDAMQLTDEDGNAIAVFVTVAANTSAVDGSTVFGDGAHLTTVTFADKVNNVEKSISASKFNIGQNAFASTGLQTVTFGNINAAKDVESTFTIEKNAFYGGDTNTKIVTFGKIADNNNGKLTATIGETAFAADMLTNVKIGDMDANKIDIKEAAFQGKNLSQVNLGHIKATKNGNAEVSIADNAFQGGENDNKSVTIGEMADYDTKTLTVTIGKNAFAADKLYQVLIAYEKSIAASSVSIGEGAFQGKSLQMVQIGNITTGKADATVVIGKDAFQGGEVTHKTVKIGNIVDGEAKLTATIGENAFAGKLLDKLTIGDMTATSIAISGPNAFANTSEDVKQNEVISLGTLGAGLQITGTTVFQAPKAAGSTYDVTIAGITGNVGIPASTFVAPVDGEASYTVTGDITASSLNGVKAGAFQGSQKWEKGAAVDNTTKVWFQGDYNCDFNATGTFTNVSDLIIAVSAEKDADGNVIGLDKAKNYNVAGGLGRFAGFKTLTIGNIPKAKSVNGNYYPQNANIEEVTFFGSVEGAIQQFYSTKIRKIDFKNVDQANVLVVEGAVKAAAFQAAAADAASKNEDITVRYYEGKDGQTREAKQIFNQQAFGTAWNDAQSVTLYTTPWAKTNVFEAADVKDANKKAVYRLKYSDSEVAPGDDIVADVYKKEGNTYAYGKLYIPKGVGMKYMVAAEYDPDTRKNAVQLYYGRIDNSNNEIFMYNLPVIDGYYWIDCTDVDQVFVARTNTELKSEMKVEALAVPAEKDAEFTPGDADHYYWGAALAVQNQLRYATQDIIHSTLMDNAEFKDRNVYYMANPKKYGLSFIQFNKNEKYTTTPSNPKYEIGDFKVMAQKSLYVVGKVNTNAPELTIVFVDDENADGNLTGIENVKAESQNSDAIYNLQGVRVNNAQKGIYIMNGKKVVIK